MRRLLTKLRKSRFPYKPLINIEINSSNLINNLSQFRKLARGAKVAPVLKSNAYGHGLIEVAQIFRGDNDIPFFVVDTYFEAIQLRNNKITTPLLIIGYTPVETIFENSLKNIYFAVSDIDILRALFSKTNKETYIHLKFDTGMRRQGILTRDIQEVFSILETNIKMKVCGLCSHFSDADNDDETFTINQIIAWNNLVKECESHLPYLKYIHISNTAGHKYAQQIKANTTRLGIGLYGLDESNYFTEICLKPALTMKTVISGIKKISKDETVGYGNTFKADKDMTIATIPVGYYEGVDRRLSNKGFVSIGGVLCPILGRVSMNITTIDVSNILNAKIGDEVLVFSNEYNAKNSIDNIASICNTIPYEIAVHIPAHLKRIVV